MFSVVRCGGQSAEMAYPLADDGARARRSPVRFPRGGNAVRDGQRHIPSCYPVGNPE